MPCREGGGVPNGSTVHDWAGRAALATHLAALRKIAGG